MLILPRRLPENFLQNMLIARPFPVVLEYMVVLES
jgi:hypothetical protein